MDATPLDMLIFGGGVAGLWLLDEAVRKGYSAALVEAQALGQGQTVAAQGIIHGGLKYTLKGQLTGSAKAIREMPTLWRECIEGVREPDLRGTTVRSDFCYLWRTASLWAKLGMVGAKQGLVIAPQKLSKRDWPQALRGVRGQVLRLDEQVISPASMLQVFRARHESRLMRCDPFALSFAQQGDARVVSLRDPTSEATLQLAPKRIVLCAGAGNQKLRESLGLSADAMQRRPLHMVMVKGAHLPPFNGHCVDGAKTRITVTSDRTSDGEVVWQLGGQISEDGVRQHPPDLIATAKRELSALMPAIDWSACRWATYRVDRAEPDNGGSRPDDCFAKRDAGVITAWPTKMVMAPRLAEKVLALCDAPEQSLDANLLAALADCTRPDVALEPWEGAVQWSE